MYCSVRVAYHFNVVAKCVTISIITAAAAAAAPVACRRESDKLERVQQLRESLKRVPLGPTHPPSICAYTLLNTGKGYSYSYSPSMYNITYVLL